MSDGAHRIGGRGQTGGIWGKSQVKNDSKVLRTLASCKARHELDGKRIGQWNERANLVANCPDTSIYKRREGRFDQMRMCFKQFTQTQQRIYTRTHVVRQLLLLTSRTSKTTKPTSSGASIVMLQMSDEVFEGKSPLRGRRRRILFDGDTLGW